MSGHLDDRWHKTVKNPDGSKKKVRSARYEQGQRWRVRYVDPGGKERSKSFELRDDAEKFLTDTKAALQNDNYMDPGLGKITLRIYSQDWLKARTFAATTRERVAQRLNNHILPSLGDMTLRQLSRSPSAIQAWIKGLRGPDGRPLAPGHAQAILSNLSAIMTAAVDDGCIGRNPCRLKSVQAPKADKKKIIPWTIQEVTSARDALPGRYRALADLGAMLGLRQGEAFGLAVEDVNFLKRTVHVRRQVRIVGSKLCFAPPKGGKERDVPLPDLAGQRIAAHLQSFPAVAVTLPWEEPGGREVTANLMTTTTARHALDRAYFHRLWRSARAAAGKPNEREHGFHALRHAYASAALAGGTDIRALSEHLGHENPGFTLRIYTHLTAGASDRTRSAIDAAFADGSSGPQTVRDLRG